MRLRRKLLNNASIYLILDREVNTYVELFEIAKKAVKNGVDIIQLRDKTGTSKNILKFSKRILDVIGTQALYIINDRVDLAMASGACSVHLGQEDMPLVTARRMMGKSALIGVSCQTFAQAQKAQAQGADYIGLGSVFKTLTKPDRSPMDVKLLRNVFKNISVPVFAIGGINLKNMAGLRRQGVNRIAVCRAICQAGNVPYAVQQFKKSVKCGRSSVVEPQLPKLVT